MTLQAGTRLGPYELVAPIGAGGMGEVYRARDTRLERNVAIKILPAELAADAQLRLRLEREAKTISSLNHPHICTLYDIGHDNGSDFLVMELLEGESLADRLMHGPLSTEEVLRYGIEIAEALDRAHRQGIVHRDLKPANVMLTKSGTKLLDFGLAKTGIPLDLSGATQQKPLTREGTIVGTFQYMSPEQLEGVDADPRSDIFALGALLYEMATGKRAFDGKTKTSLIAAIVSGRPTPVSQIQPLTPPALEHVIERCLEKDPSDRWQSANDVAAELKWINTKGSQAGVAAPVIARRKTRERLSWLLHVVTAALAVGLTWGVIELRKEPPRVVQSTILPPEKTQFAFAQAGSPALSPDGTRIVFPALAGNRIALYVRGLNTGTAQPLAGTEEGAFPFWSPDGRSIGFFAGGKLKKIDASGGSTQTIADAVSGRGGTWSSQGVIVFSPSLSGGLLKVSDSGGAATPVTHPNSKIGETTHRWPSFLPDGEHFLYLANAPGLGAQRIMLGSILDTKVVELTRANANAIYSATGHLVYVRERSLVAQRFDAKTFKVGRDAIPIAENVIRSGRLDACFTVSPGGTLAYIGGAGIFLSQLQWVDSTGKVLGTIGKQADYTAVALSHDGRRAVASILDPGTNHQDLWIEDIARGTATRLTFDTGDQKFVPVWSPDDSMILFTSNVSNPGDLAIKPSSGTGAEEVIYANPALTVASDWSPDGKTIAFMELDPEGKTNWDLWLFSLADRKATPLLRTPYAELQPKFSPDGRWILYMSNESGRNQVYVMPVSGRGGKWQISTDGGDRARWSRDGKRIYYLAPDYKLMAVDVSTRGTEFVAGVPQALFPLNAKRINGTQYDVSADGKRFVVNTPIEQTDVVPLTLVQNWTAALKK